MTDVRRIMPYLEGDDFEALKAFYCETLGLEVTMEGEEFLGLGSAQVPAAQLVVGRPGRGRPRADMGVDVGDADAVDAAHAEAVRRGLEVVYGPADEPWGIYRFFVRDPTGAVVSVLAHR